MLHDAIKGDTGEALKRRAVAMATQLGLAVAQARSLLNDVLAIQQALGATNVSANELATLLESAQAEAEKLGS